VIKVVFVPRNGGSTTQDNWFPSLKKSLKSKGFTVVASNFPDPKLARESCWLLFLIDELKVDHNTILVGHSSGAIAWRLFQARLSRNYFNNSK
jgi:predicted alpha/beta hydrolase family esterase